MTRYHIEEETKYKAQTFVRNPWQVEELATDDEVQPKMMLVRMDSPRYFVGYKSATKKLVWSVDPKYARQFEQGEVEAWIHSINEHGEAAMPVWSLI